MTGCLHVGQAAAPPVAPLASAVACHFSQHALCRQWKQASTILRLSGEVDSWQAAGGRGARKGNKAASEV